VFASLLIGSFVASTGVLVSDSLAIGMFDGSKWSSFEYSETDQVKPSKATIDALSKGGSFLLGSGGTITPKAASLGVFEMTPMGYTWGIENESDGLYWVGSQPKKVPSSSVAPTSAVYRKAVVDFLKTKGFAAAKPVIESILKADLDGNGTDEVIITFGSRKLSDMQAELSPYPGKKFPKHYAGMLIRYASGSTAKTFVAHYTDGKKGGLSHVESVVGVWDLDGQKGAEIIVKSRGWEDSGAMILKFTGGKTVEAAGNGWGV
jgi:hypothetical protein